MGDIAFWRQLIPEFNIGAQPFRKPQGEHRFSDDQAIRLSRQIKQEGYFQSEPIIPPHEVESLANGIARLANAGAMPLFIGVYDEFWQFLYRLRNTFIPILGESYRLPPDYWAFHIAPGATKRGWHVHRDSPIVKPFDADSRIREDGTPRLCTIWIPFTDATTHNSCIYVLPYPHDPVVQSFLRKEDMATMQQHAQRMNLTAARALPAQAGSVLGWSSHVLHWGSQSTDWATHPRVSVGIYYEAADGPRIGVPFDDAGRRYIDMHDPGFRLDFQDRLAIIANILAIYIENSQMVNEQYFSPAVAEFCQRWKRKG
jgi:hypothetical protein